MNLGFNPPEIKKQILYFDSYIYPICVFLLLGLFVTFYHLVVVFRSYLCTINMNTFSPSRAASMSLHSWGKKDLEHFEQPDQLKAFEERNIKNIYLNYEQK